MTSEISECCINFCANFDFDDFLTLGHEENPIREVIVNGLFLNKFFKEKFVFKLGLPK